jgi:hypothetical protein
VNTPLKQIDLVPPEAPAAQTIGLPTPMDMLNRAVAQGAGVEVLAKLMDLQERHERNLARRAFDAALADAKSELPVIFKNRTVDFTSAKGRTNYRHEDLAEIARTVDPILAKHGLSYRFRTSSAPNEPISVTCIVSHRQGYYEENTLVGGKDDSGNKNPLQQVGSTLTYLQRYALKAALGLAASTDDDAGGVEDSTTITDAQLSDLQRLADEVGADVEKFCIYLKVPSLADIPAGMFKRAKTALEAKRVRA